MLFYFLAILQNHRLLMICLKNGFGIELPKYSCMSCKAVDRQKTDILQAIMPE